MSARVSADALLLDMDGTLVDSTDAVEKHWALWAQRRGLEPALVLRHAHGTPSRDVVGRFVAPDEVEAETNWVEGLSLDTLEERALPGALIALTQPLLPVAVVTSATRTVATARLQRAGLPVPAVLVTAEDVAHGKPDPEPYRRAAALLGVRPDRCVGVEDTPAGIASVRAAGATALAVTTTFPAAALNEAVAVLDSLARITVVPGAVEWAAG